jgi:sugar lactone lactonase YvrE
VRRARLALFLYLFVRLAVPSDAMALSPGDYIVTDSSRQSIFQIDGTTGDRTVISGCLDATCTTSVGGGAPMSAPSGLARASNSSVDTPFYVSNPLEVSILQVDPQTGIRTDIFDQFVNGGSGVALASPAGMVLQSNGNLLVVDEGLQALVEVNLITGERTIVSGGAGGSEFGLGDAFSTPHDLVIDSSGDVLIVDTMLHAIFRVDLASGDRNIISSLALGGGDALVDPRNITRDSAGNILVSDSNSNPDAPGMVYRVDPDTGVRTFVSAQNIGPGTGPNIRVASGLTVDDDDNIVLLDFGPGIVLSITALTGDRSVLSSSQTDQINLSLEGPSWIVGVSVPVPEPNTVILLGIGLAMLSRLDPVKRRKR